MSISIQYCYSSVFHSVARLLTILVRWLPASSNGTNVTAQTVRKGLHVATYGEMTATKMTTTTTCAVCLSEVRGRDRVLELRNCRHVFHEGCLDRWMDHDERVTCPLCRAPLMTHAQAKGTEFSPSSQPSWAVERLLYLFGDDLLLN